MGTAAGSILRMADPYGNPAFAKDAEGNAVKSQLNEALLKEVAVNAEWKRVAIAVEDLYTPDY